MGRYIHTSDLEMQLFLDKHYRHRYGTTKVITTITGIYHGYSQITGIYIACIVSLNPLLDHTGWNMLTTYPMTTAGSKISPACRQCSNDIIVVYI